MIDSRRLSTRIAVGQIRAAATDHGAYLRHVARALTDQGYRVLRTDHTSVGAAHAGVLHLEADTERFALEWSDAFPTHRWRLRTHDGQPLALLFRADEHPQRPEPCDVAFGIEPHLPELHTH